MAHAFEGSSPALRFDIIAGLTAAAVVLPKAMAYAAVAGLPVSVGLYTAFVPMIVYALLATASILRLGFVANFISTPVLTGFKAGIGLVIVLDQVPKLLGIHITKEGFLRDILSM